MAKLDYNDQLYTDTCDIRNILTNFGVYYSRWETKDADLSNDSQVLEIYKDEIAALKEKGGYLSEDLVALDSDTPNLETICEKFSLEHHHLDDEVRFVVEGEGVFEIFSSLSDESCRITCGAGDLIVIPAYCRHLFYLTEEVKIRCIRLFKDQSGWEAIYTPHVGADDLNQATMN